MVLAAGMNRDKFNKAASYASLYRQPERPSTFKRTLKKIFLMAVMAIGVFMPSHRMTEMPLRQDTAITETDTQGAPPPVVVQQAQPEKQAEAPYVSVRAGRPVATRGLTAGETKLLRDLFGNKIDLDGMRLHSFAKEQGNYRSDVGPGETKNVEFYGRRNSSEDFSAGTASQFGSFVHEMTFVLQNQKAGGWKASDVEGYNYPLGSQWNFSDYGPQQQRSIVEDYALRFLHPDRQSSHLPHTYGDDRDDTDPFLIRLVENHFPAAKAARIAFQRIEKRALTPGEAAIIKGIFGDQINTDIISQNLHPQEYSDVAGTATSSRDANYWGPRYYSKDFSKEKNSEKFGTFIHENTHLWQFQTNWRFSPSAPGVYKYPLETKWKFTDYTHEQQAAIVEDYAMYFLHPAKDMRWLPGVYNRDEIRQKLPLLKNLVETQFPGARKLRENYEAQQQAAKKPVTMSQQQQRLPGPGLAPAFG